MNPSAVDPIVQAVLYEGYILYPYRPSVKNCQRWTFGALSPAAWCEANPGSDASAMRTQCLLRDSGGARVHVKTRFLHLTDRTIEAVVTDAGSDAPRFQPVASLAAEGRTFHAWQEAVEREIDLPETALADLASRPIRQTVRFPAESRLQTLQDANGTVVGRVCRRQLPIDVRVELAAEALQAGLWRVTVDVANDSALDPAATIRRQEAMNRSAVSTHIILGVTADAFVSQTDPPADLRDLAGQCQNIGCWPILVGEEGRTDTMLASPVILYDWPRIAPQSPGDLFDGTEIDEILTLRILTLTEEEKRQAVELDPLAARMLERTESLTLEQLQSLHGIMRPVESRNLEPNHA